MGKFDSIINAFKMNNEDEDYDDYDEYEDYDDVAPKSSRKSDSASGDFNDGEKKTRSFLSPMSGKNTSSKKGTNMNNMEVCVIKPTTFEEALQIADALLEGRSVVLNLEGINSALAQRIVDFVTGVCYSLKAHFESISKFVFVITPEAVYISGATTDSGIGMGAKDFEN
ncbi:MAG: cell division protein SepF [Lachnospiraceae bacterium]|nr:cell division protein SepF [Lachnospiraceae bacterium]